MPPLAASAQQFPQAFTIELLVPAASDFDVESHVKQGSSSPITPRDLLFFGTRLLPSGNTIPSDMARGACSHQCPRLWAF